MQTNAGYLNEENAMAVRLTAPDFRRPASNFGARAFDRTRTTPVDPGMVDITFFIACYNEEHGIVPTIETILAAMRQLGLSFEMIVVDDHSRDRSRQMVKEFQANHPRAPLGLIENRRNKGLGRNFFTTALLGQGRYYKLVCGDNVTTQETLVHLCKHLGDADIIAPHHAVIEGRTMFRTVLSRVYTWLVNRISGHNLHYYNGCGIFRRTDVVRSRSRAYGFGFQAELITRLLDDGATILEIAVPGLERARGRSSALRLRNWISVSCSLVEILFRRIWRSFCKRSV
jgi:glycosyltransferase involved in cell wall biosynthesis